MVGGVTGPLQNFFFACGCLVIMERCNHLRGQLLRSCGHKKVTRVKVLRALKTLWKPCGSFEVNISVFWALTRSLKIQLLNVSSGNTDFLKARFYHFDSSLHWFCHSGLHAALTHLSVSNHPNDITGLDFCKLCTGSTLNTGYFTDINCRYAVYVPLSKVTLQVLTSVKWYRTPF